MKVRKNFAALFSFKMCGKCTQPDFIGDELTGGGEVTRPCHLTAQGVALNKT